MADQGLVGASNNRTCQFCQRHEATQFCQCTDTSTLFCLECYAKHSAKYPGAHHQILPVAALSQNPEEYKRKYETLTKAAAELRSNIDKMEQCSICFGDMMQKCINYLIEYRTGWLQQLHTDKEELTLAVETAIREATHCLDQGVEPGSALGRAMCTLSTEELHVFKYTVSTPDLSTLCVNWASYENDLSIE